MVTELAASPVRQHLLAMMEIVDNLAAGQPEARPLQEAHLEHARRVAMATTTDPLSDIATTPPDIRERLSYIFGHLVSSHYESDPYAAASGELARDAMTAMRLTITTVKVMEMLAEYVFENYRYTGHVTMVPGTTPTTEREE